MLVDNSAEIPIMNTCHQHGGTPGAANPSKREPQASANPVSSELPVVNSVVCGSMVFVICVGTNYYLDNNKIGCEFFFVKLHRMRAKDAPINVNMFLNF